MNRTPSWSARLAAGLIAGSVLLLSSCSSTQQSSSPAGDQSTSVEATTSNGAVPANSTLASSPAPAAPAALETAAAPKGSAAPKRTTSAALTTTTQKAAKTPNPKSSTAAQPVTAAVPAPVAGNVHETVQAVAVVTAAPITTTSTGSFGNKITASIVKMATFTAVAQGPGEISGPAISVTIRIVNGSDTAIDLSQVVVNLTDKAGTPGIPMLGNPASPVAASLKAGETAQGVYVFGLPATHVNPLNVSVSESTAAPVLLFVGDAS